MLQSTCFRPSATIPMPPLNEPNDFTPPHTNHRSFLITWSARALGSLGFGLSILAIWLRWVVPSAKAVGPAVITSTAQAPHRSRRRSSLPAPSGPSTHQRTLPIMINGTKSNQDTSYHYKRVYFADTPISQRNTPLMEPTLEVVSQPTSMLSTPPEESPESSFSSMSSAATHPNLAISKRDTYDESIAESDSSSRRSSLSSHLPRIVHPFKGKTRTLPLLQLSDDIKPVKRSSIGFAPPWSLRNRKATDTQTDAATTKSDLPFRRPSTPKGTASLRSPSADSVQSPIISHFSKKSHRRTSTPIPRTRTQPYGAPYFATPPIHADLAFFDLQKSPQILDEAFNIDASRKTALARQAVSDENESRGRQPNAQAKAALRPRTLPRRRSASESWINGQRTQRT